jgi:hypothetical protein
MGVVYGITVAPENDRYITIAEKALEGMSKAANPGEFLVDIIPIRAIRSSSCRVLLTLFLISEVHPVRGVHYKKVIRTTYIVLPCSEWVPGAGFQRKAREWREAVMEMRDAPYAVVQTALVCLPLSISSCSLCA